MLRDAEVLDSGFINEGRRALALSLIYITMHNKRGERVLYDNDESKGHEKKVGSFTLPTSLARIRPRHDRLEQWYYLGRYCALL